MHCSACPRPASTEKTLQSVASQEAGQTFPPKDKCRRVSGRKREWKNGSLAGCPEAHCSEHLGDPGHPGSEQSGWRSSRKGPPASAGHCRLGVRKQLAPERPRGQGPALSMQGVPGLSRSLTAKATACDTRSSPSPCYSPSHPASAAGLGKQSDSIWGGAW